MRSSNAFPPFNENLSTKKKLPRIISCFYANTANETESNVYRFISVTLTVQLSFQPMVNRTDSSKILSSGKAIFPRSQTLGLVCTRPPKFSHQNNGCKFSRGNFDNLKHIKSICIT